MFHSDACRARYNRQQRKADGFRPVLSANRPVLTERQVEIRLSILVVFEVKWGGDLDQSLINRPIRAKMSRFLAAWLSEQHPDCKILAVKVEKVEA
jgi:hypothetical protein